MPGTTYDRAPYPNPQLPHRCELDRWQTDPADPDFIPEFGRRWCRVCLLPPRHPRHTHEPPRKIGAPARVASLLVGYTTTDD